MKDALTLPTPIQEEADSTTNGDPPAEGFQEWGNPLAVGSQKWENPAASLTLDSDPDDAGRKELLGGMPQAEGKVASDPDEYTAPSSSTNNLGLNTNNAFASRAFPENITHDDKYLAPSSTSDTPGGATSVDDNRGLVFSLEPHMEPKGATYEEIDSSSESTMTRAPPRPPPKYHSSPVRDELSSSAPCPTLPAAMTSPHWPGVRGSADQYLTVTPGWHPSLPDDTKAVSIHCIRALLHVHTVNPAAMTT